MSMWAQRVREKWSNTILFFILNQITFWETKFLFGNEKQWNINQDTYIETPILYISRFITVHLQ